MQILLKIFEDKKNEFKNSFKFYEYLSLLVFVYSAFINYPNFSLDGIIANCSFGFLYEITEQIIINSENYPIYFIKVKKI
jgi:hypothetical protein